MTADFPDRTRENPRGRTMTNSAGPWRKWHADKLASALAGVHRDVLERLMGELQALRSARELVDFISAQNWEAIDADTRLIALHEINVAISALRQSRGLEPIDDPLPGQQDNVFRIIKAMFESFPPSAGEPAGGKAR